jgi:hypothetical protein
MHNKIYCSIFFLLVSATGFTQVKDTMVFENKVNNQWQNSSRNIITYSNCKTSYVLSESWDVNTNTWQQSAQTFYVYDNKDRQQELTQQYWDAFSNQWINSSRGINNYAVDNSSQSTIFQQWDAVNNTWVNSYRFYNYYDTAGFLSGNEFDFYSNNMWLKNSRTFVDFDNLHRLKNTRAQIWQTNEWQPSSKQNFEYRNNESKDSSSTWDATTQQWIKTNRDFNNLLSNTNNTTEQLTQFYSGTIWVNSGRQKSNYNNDGYQTTGVSQLWNVSTSSWDKFIRSEFTYYDNDIVHQFTIEIWDAVLQQWSSGGRVTSTNNGCGLKAQLISNDELNKTMTTSKNISAEKMFTIQNPGKLIHQFSLKNSFNKDAEPYSFNLIFSTNAKAVSVKKEDIKQVTDVNNNIKVYPNPAHNYFNIDINNDYANATLKIIDAAGKIVKQQQVNAGVQNINISSLQKGLYILTINTNNKTQQQKLVIY